MISIYPLQSLAQGAQTDGVGAEAAQALEPGRVRKNTNPLFVFIGEKIDLRESDQACPVNRICLDRAYQAKYRILQKMHGDFDGGEVIEFTAYDHYGSPMFGSHRYVMLFVSKQGDRWLHVKYQYVAVDPTRDGGWAMCGNPSSTSQAVNGLSNTEYASRLQAIDFYPALVFDLQQLAKDDGSTIEEQSERFPKPLFEVKDQKATCKMGVRANDLFELKKMTVLKQRGFF